MTSVSLTGLASTVAAASSGLAEDGNVPGEWLVGYAPGVSPGEAATTVAQHGGTVIRTNEALRTILVKAPEGAEVGFAQDLATAPGIAYMEPNRIGRVQLVPNDPQWPNQYGPTNIRADLAWDTQLGRHEIRIAILDTGVDLTHVDLAAHLLPDGWDFVNNDATPADDHGHGTHVTGIAAAETNNAIGIAGVANVRFLPVKVCDANGGCTIANVANGITYATDHGARIISMSLGYNSGDTTLLNAVRYANSRGVLLVAAAGNKVTVWDWLFGCGVKFPAAYAEVIAVSAIDQNSNIADFSCTGPEVELAAPGVTIRSTLPGNQYGDDSGTSMSAPHVTGAAALVWSQFQGYSRDRVREILQTTADDLGAVGRDNLYGFGRVDALESVQTAFNVHQTTTAYFYDSTQQTLVDIPGFGGVRDTGIPDNNHADGHQLTIYSNGQVVEWSVWYAETYSDGSVASSSTTTVTVPHYTSFVVTIWRAQAGSTNIAFLFCRENDSILSCNVLRTLGVTANVADGVVQTLISVPGLGGVGDTGIPDSNHGDGHLLRISTAAETDGVEWSVWQAGNYIDGFVNGGGTADVVVPHYRSFMVTIFRATWVGEPGRYAKIGWLLCKENDSIVGCTPMQYGTVADFNEAATEDLVLVPGLGRLSDAPGVDNSHADGHQFQVTSLGSVVEWTVWSQGSYAHNWIPSGGQTLVTVPHYRSFIASIWRYTPNGWTFCKENDYIVACAFL